MSRILPTHRARTSERSDPDWDQRESQPFSRRFKKWVPVLLLFLILLLFVLFNGGVTWIRGALGIRDRSYDRETAIRVFNKGEVPEEVDLLTALGLIREDDGGIRPFKTGKQAVDRYPEKLLSALLRSNYDYYAGNSDLLETVEKRYPSMHPVVVIPEGDLEILAYRWFGGAYAVKHGNYGPFVYLPTANAYTTAAQIGPAPDHEPPEIILVEETAHTWRLTFRLTEDGDVFLARYVKREDGTVWLASLTVVTDRDVSR